MKTARPIGSGIPIDATWSRVSPTLFKDRIFDIQCIQLELYGLPYQVVEGSPGHHGPALDVVSLLQAREDEAHHDASEHEHHHQDQAPEEEEGSPHKM